MTLAETENIRVLEFSRLFITQQSRSQRLKTSVLVCVVNIVISSNLSRLLRLSRMCAHAHAQTHTYTLKTTHTYTRTHTHTHK